MSFHQKPKGEFGILLTLGVLATAWVLNWLGFFNPTDLMVSDLFQQVTPKKPRRANVLLVHTDENLLESDVAKLHELIEQIYQFDPQMIGVVWPGTKPNTRLLEDQSYFKDLVYGLEVSHWNEVPQKKAGFVDLFLNNQAVYRDHFGQLKINGETYDSFENVLARKSLLSDQPLPKNRFGIKFFGGSQSLPNVTSQDFFDGKIIPELVQQKVVLIGPKTNWPNGFVTPTTDKSDRMGRLELHGQILQTLLTGKQISFLGNFSAGILIAIIALIVCQAFRQIPNSWSPRLLIGCIVIELVVGWAALEYFSFRLPISAMCMTTLLGCCSVVFRRLLTLEDTNRYWRTIRNLNSHENDLTSDQPWEMLRYAVFQMFYPKRMCLMELKSGATHLNIVRTINCTAEGILERRRDIQREPYRTAVESGLPYRIEDRCFFTKTEKATEWQYMVPLILGAELYGFMVISMDENDAAKWQNFEDFLAHFAGEMAIFVANNRANQVNQSKLAGVLQKLQSLPEEKTFQKIQAEESKHREELLRLHKSFENNESALAICDSFGRVLRANTRLIRMLQQRQIAIGETTCVDLISKLSERPVSDCRRFLRNVINQKRTEQIFVQDNQNDETRVLHIKPLITSSDESNNEFAARKVVIEIVDGKIFEMVNHWQHQLTDAICENANKQITTLKEHVVHAQNANGDHSSMSSLFGSLGDTVSDVVNALEQCQAIARNRISEAPADFLPLSTKTIFQSAQDKHRNHFDVREVTIDSQIADDLPDVLANPFLLEKVYIGIFDMLLQNAFDGSTINVTSKVSDRHVVYTFRNVGGGTPLQALRKSLLTEETDDNGSANHDQYLLSNEQTDHLAQIKDWLKTWNGSIELINRSDYGLVVELRLHNQIPNLFAPTEALGIN